MQKSAQDPAEGSRETIEHELNRSSGKASGPQESRKDTATATDENGLTVEHTHKGDGNT
ncbi:MAG: hypothetical protein JWO50_885, partial [Candidatus Kaiserbacteria bacterium]|nr:hypothetical protein [Candidatus Kaiserbacteria bacterium]